MSTTKTLIAIAGGLLIGMGTLASVHAADDGGYYGRGGGPMMGRGGPGMGPGPSGAPGAGPGMEAGPPWMRQVYSLNLSTEQRATVDKVFQDMQKKGQSLGNQMREAFNAMPELFQGDVWDAAKINAAYDKLHQLQTKMRTDMVEGHNKVFAALTDEQKQQMHEFAPPTRREQRGYPPPR